MENMSKPAAADVYVLQRKIASGQLPLRLRHRKTCRMDRGLSVQSAMKKDHHPAERHPQANLENVGKEILVTLPLARRSGFPVPEVQALYLRLWYLALMTHICR